MDIFEYATGLAEYVKANGGDPDTDYHSVYVDGVFTVSDWKPSYPQPTEDDVEPYLLEALKQSKINEFHRRGLADLAEALPEGQDELLAILNAHIIAICNALGISPDQRLLTVDERQQHAFGKKVEIAQINMDNQTLEQAKAQLQAITWE